MCFRKRGERGSPYGYAACRATCPEDEDDPWDCEVLAPPQDDASAAAGVASAAPPLPPYDSSMPRRPPALPPPPPCSERYETCWETHCCKSTLDGCYRRAGRQFAMCKPIASGGPQFCVSDENWLCPGWDAPPPTPPPTPPQPPQPPETPPQEPLPPYAPPGSPKPPPPPQLPPAQSLPQLSPRPAWDAAERRAPPPSPKLGRDASVGGGESAAFPDVVHFSKSHAIVLVLALVASAICAMTVSVALFRWCRNRRSRHRSLRAAPEEDKVSPAVAPGTATPQTASSRAKAIMARAAAVPQAARRARKPGKVKYTRRMDKVMGQAEELVDEEAGEEEDSEEDEDEDEEEAEAPGRVAARASPGAESGDALALGRTVRIPRKPGQKLGLDMVDTDDGHVVIAKVFEGFAAAACGELFVGDAVGAVGAMPTSGLNKEAVYALIAATPPGPLALTLTRLPRDAEAAAPAEKLRQVKVMLNDGLITQADYEAKKAQILAAM